MRERRSPMLERRARADWPSEDEAETPRHKARKISSPPQDAAFVLKAGWATRIHDGERAHGVCETRSGHAVFTWIDGDRWCPTPRLKYTCNAAGKRIGKTTQGDSKGQGSAGAKATESAASSSQRDNASEIPTAKMTKGGKGSTDMGRGDGVQGAKSAKGAKGGKGAKSGKGSKARGEGVGKPDEPDESTPDRSGKKEPQAKSSGKKEPQAKSSGKKGADKKGPQANGGGKGGKKKGVKEVKESDGAVTATGAEKPDLYEALAEMRPLCEKKGGYKVAGIPMLDRCI